MATKSKSYTPAKKEEKSSAAALGVLGLFGLLGLAFLFKAKATLRLENLVINPAEIYQGQLVTIQVTATNISEKTAPAIVSFYDTGKLLEQVTVTLDPGMSDNVAIQIYPTLLGIHSIKVNPGGLQGTFTVVPPPGGNIVLSDLAIDPQVVYPGDTVTITVKATNTGGSPDGKTVTFAVDSASYTRDTGVLQPMESVILSIQVALQVSGAYSVAVNGLSGSFEVLEVYVPPFSLIASNASFYHPGLYKRLTFEAEGNFFAFFARSSRLWFGASRNGGSGTWKLTDTGIDMRSSGYFSICYHPGYNVVDLVWAGIVGSNVVAVWTRGVPKTDGTIVFGQAYPLDNLGDYEYGQNCIDTFGFPWVATGGRITTSKRNDNQWVTQDGYPVLHVSYGINTFYASAAIAMANGHVAHLIGNYSVYSSGYGYVWLRRWDGFYWGGSAGIGDLYMDHTAFSGVGIGSKLHVTTSKGNINVTNYAIYDSVANQVVYSQGGVAPAGAVVTADDKGQAHLFWSVARILKWRKLDAQGIWSVPLDIVPQDPDGTISGISAPLACVDPHIYTLYGVGALLKFKGLW